MTAPQIAVIGLGATGSAALFHLARRGVRAIGIEQSEPGHDRGSSHGPTRIFRLAHFENLSYVPLLRRAYALWRNLEGIASQPLLALTGIVEIGSPDSDLIRGTLAAARHFSLPHDVLDAKALMRRFPPYELPESFVAVLQPNGGIIEAQRALTATLRIAEEAGALIRTGEQVLAIEPRTNTVRIETDRDAMEVDGAIIAAGPWMKALLPKLDLPLHVTRQVVAWLDPDDAEQFSADRFPVFILESQYGSHYGFPAYGRMGVKIAKHHHLGEVVDPDTCERKITAQDEAAIRAPLAEYLPPANGRLLDAQTCLYTMTPDDTFIIDRMAGYPHIVIASPCCGHGFKFSPVIGEIVADLVTRGSTGHDISQFRLDRFEQNTSA